MYACPNPPMVALLQLRPAYLDVDADSAAPVQVLIGVCREHVRPTRLWLEKTWSHDPVDAYGYEFILQHLGQLEEAAPVWRMVREDAVGGAA